MAPIGQHYFIWEYGMPINVMPGWIKILLLALCLAAGLWLWEGSSNPRAQETKVFQAKPGSGLERGLPGKTGANIKQFVSNPLEPTRLPGEGLVILRDPKSNYYKDEP